MKSISSLNRLFKYEVQSSKYKVQSTKFKIQITKYNEQSSKLKVGTQPETAIKVSITFIIKVQMTKYKVKSTKYKVKKYKVQITKYSPRIAQQTHTQSDTHSRSEPRYQSIKK